MRQPPLPLDQMVHCWLPTVPDWFDEQCDVPPLGICAVQVPVVPDAPAVPVLPPLAPPRPEVPALPPALAQEEKMRKDIAIVDDSIRTLEAKAVNAGAQASGLEQIRYLQLKERALSTDAVHAALAALGLTRIARHEEDDFLLQVWSRNGRSVAEHEGLR